MSVQAQITVTTCPSGNCCQQLSSTPSPFPSRWTVPPRYGSILRLAVMGLPGLVVMGFAGLAVTGLGGLAVTGLVGLVVTGLAGLAVTELAGLAVTGLAGMAVTGVGWPGCNGWQAWL